MKTNLFKKALKAVKSVIGTKNRKPAVKTFTEPVVTKLEPIFDDEGYFNGFNFDHPVIDEIYRLEDENGDDLSCEVDNNPENPINQFIALCELDACDAKLFKAMLLAEFRFVDAIESLHGGNWELDESITDYYDLAEKFFEEEGICLGDAAEYFDFESFASDYAQSENGTLTEYGYLYRI